MHDSCKPIRESMRSEISTLPLFTMIISLAFLQEMLGVYCLRAVIKQERSNKKKNW